MKIKFLLLGTSLSLIPTLSLAQCVATQDCATLGYTETSCNGGKGVKCPFGNKWACLPTEAEICKKNGFTQSCTGAGQSGSGKSCGGLYAECSCTSSYQYTCSDTGYAGGTGSACGGKYAQCTCASGYEWKNGSCQKETPTEGIVGDQYYCDGKVVGVRASGMGFFVSIENATYNGSQIMIWSNANSQAARAFCSKGRLPTKDELLTIYNNKSKINSLSTAVRGQNLTNSHYWSSTNHSSRTHYGVDMSDGNVYDGWGDSSNYLAYVRPVLTSW